MKNNSIYSEVYTESLPSAGIGTLQQFSPMSFSPETLRLKSGSMKRIRCYAGFIKQQNGNELAIVILLNHYSGTTSGFVNELEKIFLEVQED